MSVKTIHWGMPGVFSKDDLSGDSFFNTKDKNLFELYVMPGLKAGRIIVLNIPEVFGTDAVTINSVTVKGLISRRADSAGTAPAELFISAVSPEGSTELFRDRDILKDAGTDSKSFSFAADSSRLKKAAFPEFGIKQGLGMEIGVENTDSSGFQDIIFNNISFSFDIVLPVCTLTLNTEPSAAGSVSGAGSYEAGSEVSISASAADGFRFDSWSDSSAENPRKIIIRENTVLTAMFSRLRNIYAGCMNVNEIYAGNKKVKAVYAGTKRIY